MNALLASDRSSIDPGFSADDPVARPARPAEVGAEIPQLLGQVRSLLKQRHYAPRTENAYVEWIHQFLRFCPGRPVASLGEPDLRAFLEHLAGQAETSTSTRAQARAALLLLFHGVLGQRFNCADGLGLGGEASGQSTLTRQQLDHVVATVDPAWALAVALWRFTDLRPAETMVLRVRDIDLEGRCVYVRDDRGRKPMRAVALPDAVLDLARAHVAAARVRHSADLEKNAGYASLPDATRLADPQARRAFGWQWLFASGQISRDPLSGEGRRRHQEAVVVQRAVAAAARAAGILQPVTLQTLRLPARGASNDI